MSTLDLSRISLVTADDRFRRPAASLGQILRLLTLIVIAALAINWMARPVPGDAVDGRSAAQLSVRVGPVGS